jgi:LL-diaminopimelate aminotransferase
MNLLRRQIAENMYSSMVDATEVFISDGAKCDIGRMQMLFSQETKIAIQDPSYPAYLATNRLFGREVKDFIYLPCVKENNFFPDLENAPSFDLLYLCSPNNPTGAAFSRAELQKIVLFALTNQIIILYDTAYAGFIQDSSYPQSIYEIEGAKKVAMEVSSLSKWAGFTGVRLGWSVVPKELTFKDGGSVREDWIQIQETFFNGPSNISQAGALALMDKKGIASMRVTCQKYLRSADILRQSLREEGFTVSGATHCPYLWINKDNLTSWQLFNYFLEERQIVTTPGIGFGKAGEGYLRISSFVKQERLLDQANMLCKLELHPSYTLQW